MSRFGVLGNLQTKIAHTSTIPGLGNKDLRLLQEWISTEKGVVTSLLKLVSDLDKANEALTHWGGGEGADLGDILSRSRDLLSHASIAFGRFAEHEGAMRAMLKGIRTREEALDDAKKRRRNLIGKAEAAQKRLSKMGQENKQLQQQTELLSSLRHEIAQLDGFIYNEEAGIMDFKRRTTKDIMVLKFGGLSELAEKITIVGTLGKDLIEDIPLDATIPGQMRHPYGAFDKTRQTVEEAVRCVNSISFTPTPAETLPPKRPDEWAQSQSPTGKSQTVTFAAQPQVAQHPGPRYPGTPEIAEPQPDESLASPQRPELPHHLPSNVGLPSPVDLGSSTTDWLSKGPARSQAKPLSPISDGTGYSEFGQLPGPPPGRLAATFPIAAAHSRDPAYLTSPGTAGGRPSSLAYLQDSTSVGGPPVPEMPPVDPPHSAPQPYARQDSQPASVAGNPWKDETSQTPIEESHATASAPSSPHVDNLRQRNRNRDEYHYEYSDSAFWVTNNMPATRSADRSPVPQVEPAESPTDESPESPLEPPQAPAMYTMRNRSSSQLYGDRSPTADQDDAARLGVATRIRVDVSPTPSQRNTPAALGNNSPDMPRTIAAAAFKRTPRASSESFGDTSPLHVRKRGGPGIPGPDAMDSPVDDPHHSTTDDQATPHDEPEEAHSLIPPVTNSHLQPSEEVPTDAGVHGRHLPVPPPAYS
ncbi:hypothetical protein CALVIDRAFT_362283 [Calocera viscosa TUFC12733]|uniref:Eisosome component PIL1-domain-containing protein n=1 Tax=Calocera viscosa (strain TUFC12733) TaxID=1330018 RepID=A0A167H467_CALVF|nr:hypothetical protein CALVIDRAFT_362283 [Calocera viscosa TUFC12733]